MTESGNVNVSDYPKRVYLKSTSEAAFAAVAKLGRTTNLRSNRRENVDDHIREYISQRLINAIETGIEPWKRPWASDKNVGASANAVSGRAYSGVNPMLVGDMAPMACDGWLGLPPTG